MSHKATTSTRDNADHCSPRSFSSFAVVAVKNTTSAAQRHGGSEQMQRWLNTPPRQEPYVVGHGIVKKRVELCAEVSEALSILQKSPGMANLHEKST